MRRLRCYTDTNGAGWFRLKQGWQHGGLEDILKPLTEEGLLKLWKGWAMAVRADRLYQEGAAREVVELALAPTAGSGGISRRRWPQRHTF
jgi:hypothetical protein